MYFSASEEEQNIILLYSMNKTNYIQAQTYTEIMKYTGVENSRTLLY